jgi:hypothetical protein
MIAQGVKMERKTINFYSPNSKENITLYLDQITGYGYDDYHKLYVYAVGGSRFNVDAKVYREMAGDNLPKWLKKDEVSE